MLRLEECAALENPKYIVVCKKGDVRAEISASNIMGKYRGHGTVFFLPFPGNGRKMEYRKGLIDALTTIGFQRYAKADRREKPNMNIKKITVNSTEIAIVNSDQVCISDVQSALDFMMSVNYETGSHSIVINKEAIVEDFFILSTRIAGEVLQKFVTYQFKLAIVGDFSGYASKPLKDFIYESNHGKDVFFVSSEEEAVEKLGRA